MGRFFTLRGTTNLGIANSPQVLILLLETVPLLPASASFIQDLLLFLNQGLPLGATGRSRVSVVNSGFQGFLTSKKEKGTNKIQQLAS